MHIVACSASKPIYICHTTSRSNALYHMYSHDSPSIASHVTYCLLTSYPSVIVSSVLNYPPYMHVFYHMCFPWTPLAPLVNPTLGLCSKMSSMRKEVVDRGPCPLSISPPRFRGDSSSIIGVGELPGWKQHQ